MLITQKSRGNESDFDRCRSRYFVLTAKQGHQTNERGEGAWRRGWGWRSVAERVPRSPNADASVARRRRDYLSFVAHQTRGPVAAASNTSLAHTFHVAGAFSPEGARAIPDRPRAPVIIHLIGDSRPALARSRLQLARTHADFFPRPRPPRDAWKRVITCERAYNISLECKRRTIGSFEMQIGMHAPLRQDSPTSVSLRFISPSSSRSRVFPWRSCLVDH